MKTNKNLNKANSYRLSQEKLRNRALMKGVILIAPETIFLSTDTVFGKNVTIEPYVVIGKKVKIGDSVQIKSFSYIEEAKIEKKVVIGPYTRIRTYKYIICNFYFIFSNAIIITCDGTCSYI